MQDIRYNPFGTWRRGSGYNYTDKKFTGQQEEGGDPLGLYDYGARFYSTTLGRFVSADPIGTKPEDPQTIDRYSYVNNNPLRYTDPNGLDEIDYQGLHDLADALEKGGVPPALVPAAIRMLGQYVNMFKQAGAPLDELPGYLSALTEVNWRYTDPRRFATDEELDAAGEERTYTPGKHGWLDSVNPPFPDLPYGYIVGLPKQKVFADGRVCPPDNCGEVGYFPDTGHSEWYDEKTSGAFFHFRDDYGLSGKTMGLLPWTRDQIELIVDYPGYKDAWDSWGYYNDWSMGGPGDIKQYLP